MQHPYSVLAAEYTKLLGTAVLTRRKEAVQVADRLLAFSPRYAEVATTMQIPALKLWIPPTHERESGADFRTGLGQGDPINKVSTHVPRGCGPFRDWPTSAVFYLHYDHVDDASAPWTVPYLCWKWEAWNGFGPRAHGIHTGYLWSGTQHYDDGPGGKYTGDGVWTSGIKDKQLGTVAIMLALLELRPELRPGPPIVAPPGVIPDVPQAPPVGVGGGTHDAFWIQRALNTLRGVPQLVVDGSYGRRTREAVRDFQRRHGLTVDGLAGPRTIKALAAATGEIVP